MHILKLEILSNDLDKTAAFYNQTLGLPVTAKNGTGISFSAGATELCFKLTTSQRPVYHVAFNIPHNLLSEALAWMEKKVEIIDAEPGTKIADFINWNAKSFYFFDYNGNILEFIARHNLPNQSPAAFDTNAIECVSEIGLAADDVAATCNEIMAAYDIPVFSMQPRLPNFIAMGNDHGLLILSKVNRNWHLTQSPAQKHYTKVLVSHNGIIRKLDFYVSNDDQ